MKTGVFLVALWAAMAWSAAPSLAKKQKMTDEELEQTRQVDEITIKDIIIADVANLSANGNLQIQHKFLINIDLSSIPASVVEEQLCPIFVCAANVGVTSHGWFIPGNRNPPSFLPLYSPFYR